MQLIQSIYKGVDQFFFKPSTQKNLSFFRIAIGLFCIIQTISIFPDLLNIYGANGLIRSEILQILTPDLLPKVSWFSSWVAPLGISEPSSIYFLACLFIFVSIGLTLGFATRYMAFLAWFINLMFYGTGNVFSYGADGFLNICLFYCIIMPVGYYWSVDSLFSEKNKKPHLGNTAFTRFLQIHLAIAYFMGGFCKILGYQWWNGEAIWRAVMFPSFNQFDMSWMASYPEVSMVLGWGVLLMEILYPFLMFYRKTRPFCLVGIIGMHIGIALFMGLHFFALIMIILNIATFGWPYIEGWLQRFRSEDKAVEAPKAIITQKY
ncbi:MAG: HTTM domain-containing protein [Bacteroidota bacterium]